MMNDPILDAFATLARHRADAPLIVSPQHRFRVGEVEALARRVAAKLAEEKPAEGSLVGLAAPNGAGFLAGLLALRRARCAALLLDAQAPEMALRRVLAALGARGLLRCSRRWPRSAAEFSFQRQAGDRWAQPHVAVVKLTSGSTGAPRGILTPAEALVADDRALAATMGLGARDERVLAAIPMSHSYGFSSVVMPALTRGSVLVLPGEGGPLQPMRAARWGEVTFLPTVPAYLAALLKLANPPPPPSSLRLVITAGAPLPPAVAERFREVYGRPVHVFYGASECGGICFDRGGTAGERGTLGTPVEGVEITLEPPAGEDSAAGVVAVRSPAVAAGYLPEPDSRLGDGRFRTGDLGFFEGGELVLAGRLDDLINIKGKKVNPREVEAVLARLPGVEEVAVLGVPGPAGEGQVVRAVVACGAGDLQAEDLLAFCRSRLASHKVPRSVVLVERLPRTPRGKLDRAALRALETSANAVAHA